MDQTLLLLDERNAICGLWVRFLTVFNTHILFVIYDLRPKLLHRLHTSKASDRIQADPPLSATRSGAQQTCKACHPGASDTLIT